MTKSIHRAAFMAAMLLAGGAQALTIGDINVKSALGQRFEASIPVTLAAGEDVYQNCVRLEDPASSRFKNVPMLTGYTMRVDRSGKDATIVISTTDSLSEPVVRIGLLIRCGSKVSTTREFVVNQKLADTSKK